VDFRIKKGFDIALAGKPVTDITDVAPSATVAVFPLEFEGMRQRLTVSEGDTVLQGAVLMEDKTNEAFKLRAPAGGQVTSIVRGARRFVERIVITVDANADAEQFQSFSPEALQTLDRKTILEQLTTTGYLSLIRQRPFSRMADPAAQPKSIFVNAMNTGPFQADAETALSTDPAAFQAGLDLLTRLTDGNVNLCIGENGGDTLNQAQRVTLHRFSGPHPSGNTSVHIDRVDPMKPTDIVWTIKAVDLVCMGRLFLDGALPQHRIVSLGGPGVKPEARRHYRIRTGGELTSLLHDSLHDGEYRVINGDVLSGTRIERDSHLHFHQSAMTVIPADKERYFLGWTMPGVKQMSFTRTFASTWLPGKRDWSLGTNMHGEVRALVLSGHYDKVMPLNIMVDFLIRAVMAGDTDETIALGILETDPEDFALCDVICPSKVEIQDLISQGLRMIEEEGI
jgi:Na+-transporting NADH:ubiquinone oxidoreductase subunit A